MSNLIKIQTAIPEIPIEIGELKFSFSLTDENILRFRDQATGIAARIQSVELDDDEDDDAKIMKKMHEVLQVGFDFVLGEGAFAEIYKVTPSVSFLLSYFSQLLTGVTEELDNIQNADESSKANRYTRRSKKK